MTCIIGLEHDGYVYIGADSASVAAGWDVWQTRLQKVFRRGPFLIGYTTSFRMGQILQHHLEVREPEREESDDAFMVCAFIEAVRKCLKDKGFARIESNQESGGFFLVGYAGTLYRVTGDFQVNSNAGGLDALGCGADYAFGAMKALEDLPPCERLLSALKIAAHFNAAVRAPFKILKLGDKIDKAEKEVDERPIFTPKEPKTGNGIPYGEQGYALFKHLREQRHGSTEVGYNPPPQDPVRPKHPTPAPPKKGVSNGNIIRIER